MIIMPALNLQVRSREFDRPTRGYEADRHIVLEIFAGRRLESSKSVIDESLK